MTDYLLEIKKLKKDFKNFSLKEISFKLEKGYIMGFIGPNGAGKSTTIKLIMNLLKKDGGEIKVFGLDNIQHEKEIKERIGFVYDQNYFYDHLSIRDMKRIIAPLYRNWDEQLYNKYLGLFQLNEKEKIKELSKGMQMKLALTMALSHHAELLIMDEPTSGLDPLVRRELLEVLTEVIQDENKGVLFSTHITSDLDKIADYVTFINAGELVFSKAKDDILDNSGIVKGDLKILDNISADLLIGVRKNQFGFEALTVDRHKVQKLLGNRVVIDKASLEDVMLFYLN